MTNYIEIDINNVPDFLKNTHIYISSKEMNTNILIPKEIYIENDNVDNMKDFKKMFKFLSYISVLELPTNFISFINNTIINKKWKKILKFIKKLIKHDSNIVIIIEIIKNINLDDDKILYIIYKILINCNLINFINENTKIYQLYIKDNNELNIPEWLKNINNDKIRFLLQFSLKYINDSSTILNQDLTKLKNDVLLCIELSHYLKFDLSMNYYKQHYERYHIFYLKYENDIDSFLKCRYMSESLKMLGSKSLGLDMLIFNDYGKILFRILP